MISPLVSASRRADRKPPRAGQPVVGTQCQLLFMTVKLTLLGRLTDRPRAGRCSLVDELARLSSTVVSLKKNPTQTKPGLNPFSRCHLAKQLGQIAISLAGVRGETKILQFTVCQVSRWLLASSCSRSRKLWLF